MTADVLTVPNVLGIREGDAIELWRGSEVRRGVYERWDLLGETYGPDLITQWLTSGTGLRVPIAYLVEKCIADGWNLRRTEVAR